jgi:hypothetical protein
MSIWIKHDAVAVHRFWEHVIAYLRLQHDRILEIRTIPVLDEFCEHVSSQERLPYQIRTECFRNIVCERTCREKIKTFVSHSHKYLKVLKFCVNSKFTQKCDRRGVELLMLWSFIFFWPVLCVASFYSKSFLKCRKQWISWYFLWFQSRIEEGMKIKVKIEWKMPFLVF